MIYFHNFRWKSKFVEIMKLDYINFFNSFKSSQTFTDSTTSFYFSSFIYSSPCNSADTRGWLRRNDQEVDQAEDKPSLSSHENNPTFHKYGTTFCSNFL